MKDFDSRWQKLADRARQATPVEAEMPLGFATRCLARSRAEAGDSSADVWERLGLRTLAAATLVLAICLTANFAKPESRSLSPHVEEAVAQLFWML